MSHHEHDEHTEEPRVEDLDVPAAESEDVKGGAAFDAFLEIEGVKAGPKQAGKWGDVELKQRGV